MIQYDRRSNDIARQWTPARLIYACNTGVKRIFFENKGKVYFAHNSRTVSAAL